MLPGIAPGFGDLIRVQAMAVKHAPLGRPAPAGAFHHGGIGKLIARVWRGLDLRSSEALDDVAHFVDEPSVHEQDAVDHT